MQSFNKTNWMSFLAAGVIALGLLASTSASATLVHLNGTERLDGAGWDVLAPTTGTASDNRNPLALNLTINDPSQYYDFLFNESTSQQLLVSSFGLRTLAMSIGVQNTSALTLTGLHFTLIDPNAPATMGLPPYHRNVAHFHYGMPVLSGTATHYGTVAATSLAVTAIDVLDASILSGQDILFTAGAAFGIHQYEVQGQDRSFTLRVTADFQDPETHDVPLPGTLPLLFAGLISLGFLRKKSSRTTP